MYKDTNIYLTTNPKLSRSISRKTIKRERDSALHRDDLKTFERKKKWIEMERREEVPVLELFCFPNDRPMICLHVYTRSQFEKTGKLGRIDDAGQVGPVRP